MTDSRVRDLKRRGFDKSRKPRGEPWVIIGCSQCNALVIMGVASHETGCPNKVKTGAQRQE